MRAPIRRALSLLLLPGLLAASGVEAAGDALTMGPQQLPPPPGPYVSSRPNLQTEPATQGSTNRMPFVGNMPAPAMPLRYMPSPNQFPAPTPWWRGPMGR